MPVLILNNTCRKALKDNLIKEKRELRSGKEKLCIFFRAELLEQNVKEW